MPVVEATISAAIKSFLDSNSQADAEDGIQNFADELAKVIKEAITSATVTVNVGIPVTTPAGPGATSAPGTGSLS